MSTGADPAESRIYELAARAGDPAIEADEANLAGIEQRTETIRSAAKVYDTPDSHLFT